jgi:hypothetical protein
MALCTDIGDKCKRGRKEKGQTHPMKDPYSKKGPERKGKKISDVAEDKKDGPADQKFFFGCFQKGPSDKRPEYDGRYGHGSDQNPDFNLCTSKP